MAEARPPQATVMQMMMAAWTAQTIAAVTRLGVADVVAKHGPLTARQLTGEHGVNARPEFLERALRACASAGIFTEDAAGRFGPTDLSAVLTLDSPVSVRRFVELIGGRWWELFGALAETLRTGRPAPPTAPDPAHLRRFGEAMKSRVESLRGALERCDFTRTGTLVDVGGGFGHLALAVLRAHPAVRAVVLDLPEVVALAEEDAAGEDPAVRARLGFVGGDMFADVPPGDTYVLRAIVHDWDDASCVRVLRRCRARLPADGRIVCIDNVLPPLGDTGASGTKFLDMLMMVSLPGKERTEAEWRALFAAADLRVASITSANPRSAECVIVGVSR